MNATRGPLWETDLSTVLDQMFYVSLFSLNIIFQTPTTLFSIHFDKLLLFNFFQKFIIKLNAEQIMELLLEFLMLPLVW